MKTTGQIPFFIFIYFLMTSNMLAQGEKKYTVALFLYDGVELLDFSGPGEVFGATDGFNVYTVSSNGEGILSQGFVKVQPEYSIKTAPKPDILILPGGGTGPTSKNPDVLNWIKRLAKDGTITMSVCTGANILAKAGLLDGLTVTTWHGFIDRLQEILPNSTVLEDTRFVDNGNIVTTAGVSAGIDGALHLVARIKGYDVANLTAQYMEYDKWEPEDGLVIYKNPLIQAIRNQGLDQAMKSVNTNFEPGTAPFYEGEMKNLGVEFIKQKKWSKAEEVFELVVEHYPYSKPSFEALSDIYEKQGKYAPLKEKAFINMVMEGKVDKAISEFHNARETYPGWVMFSEAYVNWAGYQYLQKKQIKEAIALFKLNVTVYPKSANVYDSLGEAFMKNGQSGMAIENYKKALEINPGMESAQEALDRLRGN